MIYNRNKIKKILTMSLILIIGLNSLNLFFSMVIEPNKPINEDIIDTKNISTSAGEGLDPWWNGDFQYRRCINLTNIYNENLVDWRTYIEIDTTDLIPDKMRSDLGDIRIVENGEIRDYYVTHDGNSARIWFKTDIKAYSTEYDTYLYYGNSNASNDPTYYKEHDFGMAWYTFDSDEGGSIKDEMGLHDATLYGLGTHVDYYTDSHSGQSLKFNDTQVEAYIDAPHTILHGLTTFTISFWAKRVITSGTEYLVSVYGGVGAPSPRDNYMLYRAPTISDWRFYVFRMTTDSHLGYVGNNLEGGTAAFLASGSTTLIYSTPSTPLNVQPGGFIIGQEQDSIGGGFDQNQNYNGYLDEFRIFNYALSDTEMNWLRLGRTLAYELLEERIVTSEVTVIVKDCDGSLITDQLATVYLWNKTSGAQIASKTTGTDGTALFENVAYDNYTITVNYTKTLPDDSIIEEMVYNSTDRGDTIEYMGLIYTTMIYTDLWTMHFVVEDWDGDAMNRGYIQINITDDQQVNLTLDTEGKASFRWLNRSEGYDYSVYYDNRDLVERYTLLNKSTIYPIDKSQQYTVSEINIGSGPNYLIDRYFWVDGSSDGSRGKNKIIDIEITATNMDDTMSYFEVQLMGAGPTPQDRVVLESYSGTVTDKDFLIHASDYPYNVYGIWLKISGINSSAPCPGEILLTFSYAHTHVITANMSKLNIKLIDDRYYNPVSGMTVYVEYNDTKQHVTTKLKTDSSGYAYGINTGLPFWYTRETVYNISIWQTSSLQYELKVNSSDQPFTIDERLWGYNYSLDKASELILEVFFSENDYITKFLNGSEAEAPTIEYIWGQHNITLWINFTFSSLGQGGPWSPDSGDPDTSEVLCTIKRTSSGAIVYTRSLDFKGDGNYSLDLNSSVLSAGYKGIDYTLIISGWKHQYISPQDDIRSIRVLPLVTGLTLHDYNTTAELIRYPVSGYYRSSVNYGFTLNITARYYDLDSPTILLTPDQHSYTWDEGSGDLTPDMKNPGYWVLEFDSNIAAETKEYTFQITMGRENHSIQENIICKIDVRERGTMINGSSNMLFEIDEDVWIEDEKIFEFEYTDSLESQRLEINSLFGTWYKKESDGSETHKGDFYNPDALIKTIGITYQLDLNTEDLEEGLYKIFLQVKRDNYEAKMISITMNIKKRPIDPGFTTLYKSGEQGQNIRFSLTLSDPSNNSMPLTGVMVRLMINSINYTFTESEMAGEYYLDFPTSNYNAFFMPQTIVGMLHVSKEKYETASFSVTIVISMPTLMGIPIFYLLMIIGAIVAVVGSLGLYRYNQVRKIPKFIKKSKDMRKAISSKSKIGENLLYPSKESATSKLLGKKWESIGLSLPEILDIQEKKRKILSDIKEKESTKQGGED